jgi:protoheme IX farnesyltransferase
MTALRTIGVLCRIPVASFTAAAAFTGAVLASPGNAARSLSAAAAVFLLSCGASALNQYQEREIDARMERTRCRPLPSGTMAPRTALILSALLIASGLGLSAACGIMPALLCALAVVWYNGVYTLLKRRSAFAAVYGAPVGMLSPAIGWTAAGGGLSDPRLFAISMVFFLWQVPHFWFLLLESGDDYERAGLPSLTGVLPRPQLARVAMFWTVSAAAAALLLPLYGVVRSTPGRIALLVLSVLLASASYRPFKRPDAASFRFRIINTFIASVMVLISADALLAGSLSP